MTRTPAEPPGVNDHGELVCPYDGTILDVHPDDTVHCWRCGGVWPTDGA